MAAKDVIDNDLLALADDDSDSEGDDTKPTSRDDSRSPSPEVSYKAKTSSAPKRPAPKKRASTTRRRRDDDSEDDGEASSTGSIGSAAMSESESDRAPAAPIVDGPLYPVDGKYTSEAERARVYTMTEIEREDFLAKRMAEVQAAQQSLHLKEYYNSRSKSTAQQDKSEKKRKADAALLEDTPRKRSAAKARQSDAIAGYKASRERKAEERRRGEGHRARASRSSSRDRYSDRDAEGDSDVEWDDKPRSAPTRDEPPAQFSDYNHVRVGRSNFAKVCYYPGFEDSIRGCFCRVAIGLNRQTGENQYRMTVIKGFTTGRDYTIEHQGRPFKCNLYAILAHGKAEKEWPFTACSDSEFKLPEFERYRETIYQEGGRLPSKPHLDRKMQEIGALLERRWTEEEITAKLRKQGWLNSQQAAAERERLTVERARAVADGDEAAIARADHDLATLERPKLSSNSNGDLTKKAPSQQERLAALNRANRKANAEEIRRAQMADRRRNQKLQSAVERGEALPNPFARVKVRPKTHYTVDEPASGRELDDLFGDGESKSATPLHGNGNGIGSANGTGSGGASGTAVAAALKSVKLSRKVKDDDVVAAMDFDIEIEL